ncbi:MAG: ammonium transporter [Candidatus Limnocylindrales bacterium]
MRTTGNPLATSRVRRWAALGVLAIFAVLLVAGCAVDKTGGDTNGLTTAAGQNLVGLAPGTITSDDLTKAQTAEPFAAKLADMVDENRLAINLTWLLVTGFLVMFMQAGFALVETGFTRAKNALHTMSMNFMIYAIGIVGFYLIGFAIAFGGLGVVGVVNLGGLHPLSHEVGLTIGGTSWGIIGGTGFALTGATYDVGVVAFFLFQLVFMDTAATIPTGSMAERFAWKPFVVYGLFISGILYPVFANWAWGGGWLSQLGSIGLGAGYADFAGSGVVHSVGGWCALAGAIVLGPRIGKYNKDGSANAIPGHNIVLAILGTFILAFGWFGFNPGSTFGASGNGALRIGIVAVVTLLASGFGAFSAMAYTWWTEGKPNPGMMVNGMLAGLVAITAPSGFVGPIAGSIIGLIAGVLVCLAAVFIEKVLKVDDPVGAVAVHGVNGLWGVLATGLFADGTSNYGGVAVTGLFYGNVGQFVAQLIGAAVCFAWAFGASFVFFKVLNRFLKLRVSPETELQGLDIPEMGMVGYIPEDLPAGEIFPRDRLVIPPMPG